MNYTRRTVELLRSNSKPLFAGLFLLLAACSSVQNTNHTFATVVIDPGHGGKDSGCHSRIGGQEKNNALDVALRVDADLQHAGFHTVMTRDTDVFIPLNERAAISNAQQNAVFVSIHFNDSRNHGVHGVEAYYNSGAGAQLASTIEDDMRKLFYVRMMKHAEFRVLKYNQYPAVLVECGYLSNPSEASRCADHSYRMALADRIAAGIIDQRYGEMASSCMGSAPVAARYAPPETGAVMPVTATSAPALGSSFPRSSSSELLREWRGSSN